MVHIGLRWAPAGGAVEVGERAVVDAGPGGPGAQRVAEPDGVDVACRVEHGAPVQDQPVLGQPGWCEVVGAGVGGREAGRAGDGLEPGAGAGSVEPRRGADAGRLFQLGGEPAVRDQRGDLEVTGRHHLVATAGPFSRTGSLARGRRTFRVAPSTVIEPPSTPQPRRRIRSSRRSASMAASRSASRPRPACAGSRSHTRGCPPRVTSSTRSDGAGARSARARRIVVTVTAIGARR